MPTDPLPLLGRRVTLRHRVGSTEGRPLHSDAVGELDRADGQWVVHTRRGPVRVAPEAVRAVREIPPPRPRRAPLGAVAAVERVCAAAWPAQVSEPLGEWTLRAAGGFSGRANSALVLGDPGVDVAEALRRAAEFAALHGVPPRASVPAGTPWEAAVARAGWVPEDHPGSPVSVRVARVDAVAEPVGQMGQGRVADVTFLDEPTPPWWHLITGSTEPEPAARAVLAGGDVGYGVATVDGVVAGALRATVVQGWLHLARLTVAPEHRRAGIGRQLTVAAAHWGAERAARDAVLQVSVGNTAAERLYAGLGFTEHHRYGYWVPGAAPAVSP